VVRALADEVMVLKDGKVVEHGTSDMIFDHPKQDYTKALMAAAFALEAVETGWCGRSLAVLRPPSRRSTDCDRRTCIPLLPVGEVERSCMQQRSTVQALQQHRHG
jgi:ABC-type glutathione transport system ATPase component